VIVEFASNIQVAMQKRRDLASRVIDIAAGFSDHEKLIHIKVSSDQSIASLSALGQNFPELKANQTYLHLMRQLEELETYISKKRELYNGAARAYNTYRSSFPALLIANKVKFDPAPYYDAGNEESLNNLAVFARDDIEMVQNLLSASTESLKKSAVNLKTSATNKLNEVKKGGSVQPVDANSSFLNTEIDPLIEKTDSQSAESTAARTSVGPI
jgi:LemA protein